MAPTSIEPAGNRFNDRTPHTSMKNYAMLWQGRRLALGPRTLVMGVLNVTPDSFSDGGRFYAVEAAVQQGLRLAAEGADILDVGGESTRPFAAPVPLEEELERVLPVIAALAERVCVPISIDTVKASVARRALEAGASLVNDISALRADPDMAAVVAAADVPVILMHMRGEPRTMQVAPVYADVTREVATFLSEACDRAVTVGIPRSRIIVDPGIGFGKSFAHNLQLLRQLPRLEDLGVPILVGTSRKAFVRHLLKPPGAQDLPADAPVVVQGTQATVAAAALGGAHMVRVHDVAAARVTLTIVDAIRGA
jgi:dihydropteroate synthase